MSSERFTLDTNLLFYHVDAGAGPRHDRATQIIESAIVADCWLTLQSVSEFYAAVTRQRVMPADRAATIANDWLETFPTASASANAVRAALGIAASGRASYWDALLVVTAAEAGCTVILTGDLADGVTLHGVRAINPLVGSELPAAVRALFSEA